MEDPTEEIRKHVEETAHEKHDPSLMKIALSSALIAVLAAVASLLSEHQVNEALVSQLKASDEWAYYQAKGIKHNILEAQIEVLSAIGKVPLEKKTAMDDSLAKYKKDQEDISQVASHEQSASQKALSAHTWLSYSVTVLQVAIGMSAVAALTRRRWLWFTSMAVALGGFGLLIFGVGKAFF